MIPVFQLIGIRATESKWWNLPWLDAPEEKLGKKDVQVQEPKRRELHLRDQEASQKGHFGPKDMPGKMAHHILDLHVPESREMPQSERAEKFIDALLFSGLKRAQSK